MQLMTDGCVHKLYSSSCKFHHHAQLGSSCQGNRYFTEKAGSTARPSRTKSHLPGHFPPASQAGRRVVPALIGCTVYLQPANPPSPSTSGQVVSTLGRQTMLLLPCVPYSLSLPPHPQETHANIAIGRKNWFEVRCHSMAGKLRFTTT